MPRKKGRGQILRGLREEAVGIQINFHAFTGFLDDETFFIAAAAREKRGRRQLHFIADHNHLVGAISGRDRFFQRDLARLVRSEERRVGKECRSWWSASPSTKNCIS